MFVAPSIAVAVAQWPLPSRRPTPSLPPPHRCAFHPHCRRAVHWRCRCAVHQPRCRCVALRLLSPSCCRRAIHCRRRRRRAVDRLRCLSVTIDVAASIAVAVAPPIAVAIATVHQCHCRRVAVAPSVAVVARRCRAMAVTVVPSITIITTTSPLHHPSPSPSRLPSPSLPPRRRRAIHRRCHSAVHCWQRRCVAVAPSITVVACQFCRLSSSTHSPSCRTFSS